MRFSLQAAPGELEEKGSDFLERLQKALEPHAPHVAEVLEKALPRPEHGLKYKALRQLHEQTRALYEQQLSLMLTDIEKVINKARVDGLKKGDPTMVPFREDEAKYDQVKQLVMERGSFSELDFEEGGQFYGMSVNELLEMLKGDALQKASGKTQTVWVA